MRILVTGSRDWPDGGKVAEALLGAAIKDNWMQALFGLITVVHGDCPTGADAQAGWIAAYWGWGVEPHPAKWDEYGRAAGFIRNQEMVDAGADVCLAFIKDRSKGATHCADAAEKAGIEVKRYLFPSEENWSLAA